MDFTIVKRQIIVEYIKLYGSDRPDDVWSLGNCICVFRYYYAKYKQMTGIDHPNLSNDTIKKIIQLFPFADDEMPAGHRSVYDLEPADYKELIDGYFQQRFKNCNYSIAHFMSGNIRNLRFYEQLY